MNMEAQITVQDIQKILDEYRIGKKPLSKLLGWGETTIIRYLEGDIPTKEYAGKLQTILENPAYYYTVLEENKEQLTGVAYRKSRKAVLARMLDSKINVVVQYIVNKYGGLISPADAQAILYYSQAFSLALNDGALFRDDYQINNDGYPYLDVFKKMTVRVPSVLELPEGALSDKEKRMIDGVIEAFGWYGPKMFSSIMNREKTFFKISRDKMNNKIISHDTMKAYFKEVSSRYGIETPEDIYRYPDKWIMDLKSEV